MIGTLGKLRTWYGIGLLLLLGIGMACTREVEKPIEVIEEVPVERIVTVVVTPTAVPVPPPAAVPAPGPTVWRIGMPEDISTTNIWDVLGPDSTVYNFYALLNRYPYLYGLSDQRFDWVPSLAQGFPTDFAKEGDLWTTSVRLKSGAKWTDGTPITADDVAFTVQTALELELPGNWASIVDPSVVDHAEAVDPSTVQVLLQGEAGPRSVAVRYVGDADCGEALLGAVGGAGQTGGRGYAGQAVPLSSRSFPRTSRPLARWSWSNGRRALSSR